MGYFCSIELKGQGGRLLVISGMTLTETFEWDAFCAHHKTRIYQSIKVLIFIFDQVFDFMFHHTVSSTF